MEKIVIGLIVGGMYGLAIALYKSARNSAKFSEIQRTILFISIIFPPLLFVLYFFLYVTNAIQFSKKPEIKQLKSSTKEINNLDKMKEKLDSLKISKIISEDEYEEKKSNIEKQISNQILYNIEEYKNLKSLYENQILTENEFKNKVEVLRTKLEKNGSSLGSNQQNFRIIDGFTEGLGVAINENLFYGYVNIDNKVIIPFKYELAENFSEETALVMLGGKYGYINKENYLIIDPIYDIAESFIGKVAKVSLNNEEYYINPKGEIIQR